MAGLSSAACGCSRPNLRITDGGGGGGVGLRAESHVASSSSLLPRGRLSTLKKFAVRGSSSEKGGANEGGKEQQAKRKQSLFGALTEALDFAQVRSQRDRELLDEASEVTRDGGAMTREQYAALRRKIGGTYRDFFKDVVEVDGAYTDDGWVDKTCYICRKDTKGAPRQVDRGGRYVHVACLEERASKGGSGAGGSGFFSKLFGR